MREEVMLRRLKKKKKSTGPKENCSWMPNYPKFIPTFKSFTNIWKNWGGQVPAAEP